MLGLSQKLSRSLAALFGLALALPSAALAQEAPVVGDHYAARTGAASASGGYGASVPLALPGAKGGLSVPVQVTLGGRRFGAAGLGGDVPLSFIRHHVTAAHRRPVSSGDAAPQARDQYSVTLNGTDPSLVQNSIAAKHMAREGQRAARGARCGRRRLQNGRRQRARIFFQLGPRQHGSAA